MNTNQPSEPSDFVGQIVTAFERMNVPPGPETAATVEVLRRGGGSRRDIAARGKVSRRVCGG